jgi:hypothetical protein
MPKQEKYIFQNKTQKETVLINKFLAALKSEEIKVPLISHIYRHIKIM